MRNWDKYVTGLQKKLNRPCFGVVTKFTFEEGAEWPIVIAEVDSVIDDATQLQIIMGRIDEIRTSLNEPFDVSGYEPPKARPKAKAKATKGRRGTSKFS